ncbi:glycosyltransferase [Thalassobellus suaedae]|uniref:Glycosyltransferase n=1 Tax=Thalassobellus suaedae TaxID=3074124 RepID=A0ABY9XWL7_9FLAO|nr:glycosyltransferase [Flavobacteriaceae bacterium HL-DH14]
MIHGVPCVSFDCPYGPSDIITHNENGLLVENGNTKAFSEGILKLINNEALRRLMGDDAIIKTKKFSPENIIQQWHNLFKSLVS